MLENLISKVADFIYQVTYFNIFKLIGIDYIDLPITMFILFVGFIYLTVKLSFIQFTSLKFGFKQILGLNDKMEKRKEIDKGDKISSFKTLFTAVASSAGLNNTAGVASMVLIAGPGTVLWIPIIVFACMAFRFAEIYLAHKYRSSSDGSVLGGPFDYIERGLSEIGYKKLGKLGANAYALLLALSGLFGISLFEMNQAVQILTTRVDMFNNHEAIISLFCTILIAYVIFGGTKRIGNFFGNVMPFLVSVFLIISLSIIVVKINLLLPAINLIIEDAFRPKAIAGGALASFILCLRRIAMSNETGLGTAGIVHSSSIETNSIKEAFGGMVSPIINGFCISFVTAIVVVITGVYTSNQNGDGIILLANAFGSVNKYFPISLTIMIPIMAMNVMIGWSYYGVKCIEFVFGPKVKIPYLVSYLILGFVGAFVTDFQVVIKIVDSSVMLIALINVPLVMIMSGKVKNALIAHKKNII